MMNLKDTDQLIRKMMTYNKFPEINFIKIDMVYSRLVELSHTTKPTKGGIEPCLITLYN